MARFGSVIALAVLLTAGCGSSVASPRATCAPVPVYSSVPGGTRVTDPANGFAITLPDGWAQVDLSTGKVAPAFSTLTMAPATAATVQAIGAAAARDGYEWLAVGIGAGVAGGQSATPTDLLIDRSPANGGTLDSVATSFTDGLRASGVTGDIEDIRFTIAGEDALGIRYASATQDAAGHEVLSGVTDYIVIHEGAQFSLVFSVAAENVTGSANAFNAIAQSLEFAAGVSPAC